MVFLIRMRKIYYVPLISFAAVIAVLLHFLFSARIETVVEGRIYRSAQPSAAALEKIIKEKGIRTILNLRGFLKDESWHLEEQEVAGRYGVQLHHITLSPNDLPEYAKLIRIIDLLSSSPKPALIHCRRGIDRTGLVSALALAMENDASLPELKRQFSWRYGVLPFYRSAGPYFFSQYEQWLSRSGRMHSRESLLYWITHDYIDGNANLQFWIDRVNGAEFNSEDKRFSVPEGSKKIIIEGWAFDARTRAPVDDLSITIDSGIVSKADVGYNRPDVAKFFGLGEAYYRGFFAGWKAEFQRDGIGAGCHRIFLSRAKPQHDMVHIPTGFQICL